MSASGTWTGGNVRRAVALCGRLATSLRRDCPSVVQIEAGGYLGLLKSSALVLAAPQIPIVLSIHTPRIRSDLLEAGRLGRLVIHGALNRVDAIRVIHTGQARELEELSGRHASKILAIPNFVRTEAPANSGPREPRQTAGAFELLTIGALGARKGTPDLLRALASMRDAGVDVRCTLVGQEERVGELRAIEQLAHELGLDGLLNFLGQVSRTRVERELDHADAFVLPSLAEGLPMAVLEAMGAGLPLVVTAVGAIPEVLEQPELPPIAPDDPRELRHALMRLAGDRELRARCGAANRRRVETSYSPAATAHRFVELWWDVALRRRAHA